MKKLLFGFVVLLIISSAKMFGQNNHTFSICNINKTAANTLQFDVWMKNTSTTLTDTIYVQSPTFNINYNYNIRNSGTMSIALVSTNLPAKVLPVNCRPNTPALGNTGSVYYLRANGKTKAQDFVSDPAGFQMFHYTVIPGDSVLCARFQLKTSASSFAAQNLDLEFRSFSGTSPVTSCAFFKRYDELVAAPSTYGSGFYCVDDGSGTAVQPVSSTLSTATNEIYFNVAASQNGVLPVELELFSADASGRDVNLVWQTATEVNANRFEVERTAVKENVSGAWEKIATFKAQGTSTKTTKYAFTDSKLNTGTYQYRLKMIDFDGTAKYSKVIEGKVDAPKNYSISQNYPNPFNPSTRIEYQLPVDAKVILELYNMTGEKKAELVNGELSAGYHSADVQAASLGLPSGVYIYRIVAKGKAQSSQPFTSTKKMLLIK